MEPNRRNIITSLGVLLFGGGALVGSSALFASSTEAEADMRVVTTGVDLKLLVGDAADADVITKDNGELTIDFTSANSGGTPASGGVQPDATYQIGGIDTDSGNVNGPLSQDGKGANAGFPSPLDGTGTAASDPGIVVQNNSNELVGVTVDFRPENTNSADFPADARVFVVMHDTGQATGGTEIYAKLFDENGLVASSDPTSHEYRPVFSGEQLGVSLWVYTGYDTNQDQNQNPDLSGELTFTAVDGSNVSNGTYS